ncbi:MAG: endolytic transglycosylase MltG [Candidatus Portnoybacteria bacterium CG_4_10_14_0_2_um_filter_43_36]|uniref:Endolytic murein transglycosylase n=1 Tax=Candidatus Portnoybacteria bacterium CG_4_10_14_0_2_um_filter_43_36 TaxID=1974798 RepID=A0A2M7UDM3_9BACT|nr:MAG: endolytic transglycosylase MltG [Candidatus Portnoybacteria bacterium CG_4_10_14_0_2_um_filter_43_36]
MSDKRLIILNRGKFILFFTFVFVLLALIVGAVWYADYQINVPLDSQGQEKVFVIEKGEGLKTVADKLEKENLVRQKFWFTAYVFYRGWAGQLKAGEFILSPSMTTPEIAREIIGQALAQEIKVTIPEGFALKKIDARLAAAGLIRAGELLAQSSNLEGYLFPDTYQFEKDAGLDEIIGKMTDNFDQKVDQDLRDEIAAQGKTLKEIVALASIIEKEVSNDGDRQIVSGIFWQRLKDNYPLQSCATIAYILGIDKWRYSIDDTKIDSPYNTYQNTGLPPGPICNPGLKSIEAAIYPQKTDYYFFLSKPDGETVFSKTLEEHNLNKAKYLN